MMPMICRPTAGASVPIPALTVMLMTGPLLADDVGHARSDGATPGPLRKLARATGVGCADGVDGDSHDRVQRLDPLLQGERLTAGRRVVEPHIGRGDVRDQPD